MWGECEGKEGLVRDDDEFLMTACPKSGSGIRGERGEGTDLIMDHDLRAEEE